MGIPPRSRKGLAQFGLTLAQARERYGKREKARYRKWAETVAFTVSVQLHPGWPVATTGNMPMTDSEWLHYRDLKSRCPACKRPAHIAKRDETFYFVDDEYNPFVRHAPVKTMGSSTTRQTVIRRSTVTWIR